MKDPLQNSSSAALTIRAALDRIARNDAWYQEFEGEGTREADEIYSRECRASQKDLSIAAATSITDVAALLVWCCRQLETDELTEAEIAALGKCRDFMAKLAGI
ncbi:MAG: hypothetical protein O9333_04045 [Beijerinckiaceae bacterium]|jgi:hypothetical protein|nr:hypothetical protein [Beijerinckiaceae bacterium]